MSRRLEVAVMAHSWIRDPVIWEKAYQQKADQAAAAAARAKREAYRRAEGPYLKGGDTVICETCAAPREVEERYSDPQATQPSEIELHMRCFNTGRRHHHRNPPRALDPKAAQVRVLMPAVMLNEFEEEIECSRDLNTGDLFVFEYDRRGNRIGILEYIRAGTGA